MLEAAKKCSSVKRFIPSEFGINTLAAGKGRGKLFDEKISFQQKLRESGIGIIYFCNDRRGKIFMRKRD